MEYKPTIGLEIHAELKTKTKMFCDSLNDPDEKHPNINVCPICMGHPGTLPVINQEAVKKVIMAGLALNCKIADDSFFERKNYFYPDLPKGYQISQYQKPLCEDGFLDINNPPSHKASEGSKRIRIERIHLEEDAGRLYHISPSIDSGRSASLIDFNRAGVPLMELVTKPDLETAQEVKKFAEELQLILRYIGISDANMEKGQMRVEFNISLKRKAKSEKDEKLGLKQSEGLFARTLSEGRVLGTKVEIKNLNSIKVAMSAVEYEIKRQSELLDRGERIVQETRGWDEVRGVTVSQRSKEEAHDYRYFPEPDLPPLSLSISEELQRRGSRLFSREVPKDTNSKSEVAIISKFSKSEKSSQRRGGMLSNSINVDELFVQVPELPQQRRNRFIKEYNLSIHDIEVFTVNKQLGGYFEKVVSELRSWDKLSHIQKPSQEHESRLVKLSANYLITELQKLLYERDLSPEEIDNIKITPENFAEFIVRLHTGEVSSSGAQTLLKEMFETGAEPKTIIGDKNLAQVSDLSELTIAIKNVIAANTKAVEDYKKGKQESLKFLIGQVMKETKGRANPQIAEKLLDQELK